MSFSIKIKQGSHKLKQSQKQYKTQFKTDNPTTCTKRQVLISTHEWASPYQNKKDLSSNENNESIQNYDNSKIYIERG